MLDPTGLPVTITLDVKVKNEQKDRNVKEI